MIGLKLTTIRFYEDIIVSLDFEFPDSGIRNIVMPPVEFHHFAITYLSYVI